MSSLNSQIAGSGMGALSGAAAGAMIAGPAAPIGALVGGLAGAGLGFLGSSQKGYQLPWDQYNQRMSQIADFQNQLTGANQSYLTAIGNMYSTAYNQYLPDAAAQFAGRGLNVDSGAFAAQLARTAGGLQGQYNAQAYQSNINNINSVQNQYSSAWDAMFGAANTSNMAGFNNANSNMRAIGGLGGQLLMSRLNSSGNGSSSNWESGFQTYTGGSNAPGLGGGGLARTSPGSYFDPMAAALLPTGG